MTTQTKTQTMITENHFFSILKHNGHKCLCPNPKHNDTKPGSVSFIKYDTGSVGIRCFVCNKNFSLYDTLTILKSKHLKEYSKFLKMKKDILINNNKVFESNLSNDFISLTSSDKKDYAENFDVNMPERLYNNYIEYKEENIFKKFVLEDVLLDLNLEENDIVKENNEQIYISNEIYNLIPFLKLNLDRKIFNKNMISDFVKYDQQFDTLIIKYSDSKDNIINLFSHKTNLGKYVPKFKWRREVNNIIQNYYNVPIFYDYTINKQIKDKMNNFIIINEGVKDCLNATLLGYHSITSGGVKNLKPFDNLVIKEISDRYDFIIIALDNDKHGLEMIQEYKNMFPGKFIVNLTKTFNENEDFTDFMFRKLSENSNFQITI